MNCKIIKTKICYKISSVEVLFQCPKCGKSSKLEVPNYLLINCKNIITLSIPSGIICEHSIQAYIDKHFKVRGIEVADFEF